MGCGLTTFAPNKTGELRLRLVAPAVLSVACELPLPTAAISSYSACLSYSPLPAALHTSLLPFVYVVASYKNMYDCTESSRIVFTL